jgi:hypothetical protein
MQKFRKGDVVSVEGTVRFDPTDGRAYLDVAGNTVVMETEPLVLVRPFLEAGDPVVHGQEDAAVIATHENLVWIKAAGSGHRIVHITDLKRKEAEVQTP